MSPVFCFLSMAGSWRSSQDLKPRESKLKPGMIRLNREELCEEHRDLTYNSASFLGRAVVLAGLALGLACIAARGLDSDQPGGMGHMAGHMYTTVLRSPQPGD